jgi:hypothetical protein
VLVIVLGLAIARPSACTGDLDGSGEVTVDELVVA